LSRNATLKLNQPGYIIGTEKTDVSQSIFGFSVGDPYYFTAHVNRLGYGGYCVFDVSAGPEVLVRQTYFNDQEASCRAFHASGVSESAGAEFTMSYYCYNDPAPDPIEIWAAFDNVELFVYPAPVTTSSSATSSATPATTSSSGSSATLSATSTPSPVGSQLLVDNDFESGDYTPWRIRGSTSNNFAVVNGRATVKALPTSNQDTISRI
jgi:hypothetical protein